MTTSIQPLQKRKFKQARFRANLYAWIYKFFPKPSPPIPSQEALEQGNVKLKEAILSNAPFAAVRLSQIETQALQHYEAIQFGLQTSFPSPFFLNFSWKDHEQTTKVLVSFLHPITLIIILYFILASLK